MRKKHLSNDKYTGNLVLQKTFRQDHISKKQRINRGELPMYHVQDSHEAIIPRDMFESVQREFSERAKKYRPKKNSPSDAYPFTNRMICGKCGRHYRRKHTATGTKYEKVVWICDTFNRLGKAACDARQIPEIILEAKAAEAGGLDGLLEIRVTGPDELRFIYEGGRVVELTWHNPSRRHSWTEEMKQTARERQNKIIEERRRSIVKQ